MLSVATSANPFSPHLQARQVRAMALSSKIKEEENLERAQVSVSKDVAATLVSKALTWASLNGLVIGDRSIEGSVNPGVGIVHAPVALLPSPFPEALFQQALNLGSHFNTLVDRVSSDSDFLEQTLAKTRTADPFTDKLLDIHSKIRAEGIVQNIQLGMHRSDYMRDMVTGKLLQVEINTISSSFAGLGSLVSQLHRDVIKRVEHLDPGKVPENNAAVAFGDVLGLAWKEFGNTSAAVLVVVQPNERNMYDQFWLEKYLHELHGANVIRRTLSELYSQAHLSSNGTLSVDGHPVAVIYYRSGYAPTDYPSEREWHARLLLERSSAIKCPSISYHLAGTKKVQQELAKPNVLERFVQDKNAAKIIRECFAGLWGLDSEECHDIINKAIQQPELFVLKPQREGGGNNIYGSAVKAKLEELLRDGGAGLSAYILMQRIFPPTYTSYLLRGGEWSAEQAVSELGIFSAYLRNGEREITNKDCGYLLRTKASKVDEGGVATGFAVLDSVYLL
ncbi:glutathione synthetase, chloroplastic isoform X1 [Selaginella moellendorffii]|uniref:glutathione synthetase, chloroplastic isoform X1 n=1 Tax=Selaginella moellendorffii TaxID=88036 RepID=UPI000D1C44EB|nr:glutathione synthetase, chloroplastic isoform X1 [Selaginella moellendorffii]|eukprot:XP_024545766.1 glutathione synthetase, chloroplastic isoform X1 [Selaginella moellendorffii]